ncbi:hypothetical protein K4F52_004693 [Lecanicillium sp. MT-2017a]|nr:hypothetical protein K4F52_004693 [Lecanicillium sp. MT-2017a]
MSRKSEDLGMHDSAMEPLERLRTSNTVIMSPELFEKLYLGPQNNVKGDLRKTFGNPTPLGLVGYFILGNTFPFIAFTSYGGVFLALAATLHPFYGSAAAYSPTGSFAEGLTEPGFNASIAYFLISVAVLNVFFIVAAAKINAVFLVIFASAAVGFTLLASAFWSLAEGSLSIGEKLMVGAGASWFVTAVLGWYLLLTQVMAVMEYPINLPVGDLSQFWGRKPGKQSEHED